MTFVEAFDEHERACREVRWAKMTYRDPGVIQDYEFRRASAEGTRNFLWHELSQRLPALSAAGRVIYINRLQVACFVEED
jgi:hypothetical protein